MTNYIIFKTANSSAVGWEQRQLAHTGALTAILAEHLYSSSSKDPKVGERVREYGRFDSADPGSFGGSTHSRGGDWVITKVDSFAQESPDAEYGRVIICYCEYVPVEPEWQPIRQGKPVAEMMAELQPTPQLEPQAEPTPQKHPSRPKYLTKTENEVGRD